MGIAVAYEATRRGAEVTLVCANVSLPPPAGVRALTVGTAAELEAALRAEFGTADVLVMAAAPADFRPASPDAGKIAKRDRDGLVIELEPTTDILAGLAAERRVDQTLVGFAAEHGDGAVERGREKLTRKGLDAVVVNDISRSDIGFDADQNEVTIVLADGQRAVARAPKAEIAGAILDVVHELRTGAGGRSTVEGRP
jgi:phosphopantothenoylcysteine decarboxylase/phosphopantothenate--cysteine ligase